MKRGARLGQHFLKAPWAASALAHAAQLSPNDIVLEIGPGKGALTKVLLQHGAHVVAIEKDESLVAHLEETFAKEIDSRQLTVLSEDIRNVDPEKLFSRGETYVVAANIPYYITGEIIRQFLTTAHQPRAIILLVQKQVADRIVDSRESILSLSVKAYGAPRIVKKVPRGNFSPPPNVDSAIIAIEHISRDFFENISEKDFFSMIHAGFASKRKFLANNLSILFPKEKIAQAFLACGISEKARAEDVSLAKWKDLLRSL